MTSWPCIYNSWSEIGWFSVQLFVVCSRGPNRWTSFNTISNLKGQLVLWFALQIAFKAAADRGIGFYAQIFVRTSLFFFLQLDLYWGSVFAPRLRTRVFSVFFSFGNSILSGSCSRHRVIFSKLLSEPDVFFPGQFTLSQSSPPVRNATYSVSYTHLTLPTIYSV